MTATEYEGTFVRWGPPGTGKTTRLAQSVCKIAQTVEPSFPGNSPVVVCSLTKTAAAEAAGRNLPIPKKAVGTLHAHAFRSLNFPQVAEGMLADWNKAFPAYILSEGVRQTDDPKIDPISEGGKTHGDKLMEATQTLRARMIPETQMPWNNELVGFNRRWGDWKQSVGAVDFTDMIEIAFHDVAAAPEDPKVLVVDEAQDHSALEFALIQKWGLRAGCLILTGDPWQALYVWRGADPDHLLATFNQLPATHREVLSQSWRVPRAVHRAAMKWVKELTTWQDIRYEPRPEDGAVDRCNASWTSPHHAVNFAERLLAAGKSVMFAASCGYMLTPTVQELKSRGIPFANPWRTSRGDWNPMGHRRGVSMTDRVLGLIRPDAKTFGPDSRLWTPEELDAWTDIMASSGALRLGAKTAIKKAVGDPRPLTPEEMVQWFQPGVLEELLGLFSELAWGEVKLEAIFAWWQGKMLDSRRGPAEYPCRVAATWGGKALLERPKCYVGTIHSFKGSEADAVILYPDLSQAGDSEWRAGGEGRDSVVRTFYVGLTRAKESVHVCQPVSSMYVTLPV